MANYSREDAEKQGNAEVGAGIALLGGLGALLIGGVLNSQSNKKKQEQIQQAIQQTMRETDRAVQDIDKEIANYKAKFMGSILYADEIYALERKRMQYREVQKKIQERIQESQKKA